MKRIGFIKKGWAGRGGLLNPAFVKFKEEIPIKLRTKVSGKGDKSNAAPCIQEMSVLFACMKKNDFKETSCAKELGTFQQCYNGYVDQKRAKEELEKKGLLIPGERKLSHKQATELLKRFP